MNYFQSGLILATLSIMVCLSGCQPGAARQTTSLDQGNLALEQAMLNNRRLNQRSRIPPSVSAALVPTMAINLPAAHKNSARRFNLSVHNVPARAFFMSLVKGTRVNMVVSPKVSGRLSLILKHVTIGETLKVVQAVYGYDYRKTAFGFEVFPDQLETRMFNVNYLDADRTGDSITTLATGQISEKVQGNTGGSVSSSNVNRHAAVEDKNSGGEVITRTKIDFWSKLSATLKTFIGNGVGEKVVVNPQAGLVIIKAYPRQLHQVARYLDAIQQNMDREVILEAKIIEVDLNRYYQAGINWKILGAKLNALEDIGAAFPGTTIDNSKFPSAFQFNISSGSQFSAILRLLSTQGQVQVLSSPRVSTLNNQKAVIKVGTDQFFVTGISTSSTESAGGSLTPTQDVQLTPFFSGITLDVTPQIGPNGWVILHIHPSISKVVDQQKQIKIADQISDLPLAESTVRETDTMVRVRSGQVIVLGGLMENNTSENIGQLPFFGNIPILGTLFRNTKQTSKKSELVILLKPVVIKRYSWNNDMRHTQAGFKRLHAGFHLGGWPNLFGTEGGGNPSLMSIIYNLPLIERH